MTQQTILVLGSTGKTGSRIATRLEEKGQTVRCGSRNSETPFDWNEPQTWPAILEGVSAAYISHFPDIAFPGAV
ncbi:MAG: hypothetical protein R8G34_06510 [Paracoccaceae bacterium]|nr:hypothetical protein [Paracoccaceae bacterium]